MDVTKCNSERNETTHTKRNYTHVKVITYKIEKKNTIHTIQYLKVNNCSRAKVQSALLGATQCKSKKKKKIIKIGVYNREKQFSSE